MDWSRSGKALTFRPCLSLTQPKAVMEITDENQQASQVIDSAMNPVLQDRDRIKLTELSNDDTGKGHRTDQSAVLSSSESFRVDISR